MGPGHYDEHIPVEETSLTLIAVEGATQTILDGSREFEGREGSMLYAHGRGGGDLVVRGFTVLNGSGAPGYGYGATMTPGGGLNWWNARGEASLEVSDCRFRGNTAGPEGMGGAIGFEFLERAPNVSCEFEKNDAGDGGGHVMSSAHVTEIEAWTFRLLSEWPHPTVWRGEALMTDDGTLTSGTTDSSMRLLVPTEWRCG